MANPRTARVARVHIKALFILVPMELWETKLVLSNLPQHRVLRAPSLTMLSRRYILYLLVTVTFIEEHGEGNEEPNQHKTGDEGGIPQLFHWQRQLARR